MIRRTCCRTERRSGVELQIEAVEVRRLGRRPQFTHRALHAGQRRRRVLLGRTADHRGFEDVPDPRASATSSSEPETCMMLRASRKPTPGSATNTPPFRPFRVTTRRRFSRSLMVSLTVDGATASRSPSSPPVPIRYLVPCRLDDAALDRLGCGFCQRGALGQVKRRDSGISEVVRRLDGIRSLNHVTLTAVGLPEAA